LSRADFYTLEKKKITIYSDFLTTFDVNPTTGNLAVNTNENAVKRSLRNLILTNVGERLYDSRKGTKVRGSLFELFDPVTLEVMRMQITQSINAYEPRANPFTVQIVDDIERDAIRIRISFQVINIISPPVSFDVFVQKVR
tara:strand:- start:1832 stop:2254 length:423 start_codon:yes stop_codon:yes gene_type:complete